MLIHGGVFGDELTHSVNVPIYQASTYQQFELEGNPKWEYSLLHRMRRRDITALRKRLACMESADHVGEINPKNRHVQYSRIFSCPFQSIRQLCFSVSVVNHV